MSFKKFEINQKFPGPVPQQEGPVLEIWPPGGLVCIIQMPGLSRQERQAFKKSFKKYAYLESATPVPIALWVFDFPKPFGAIDCGFDARKCTNESRFALDHWMQPEEGSIKNVIHFFVLDGSILKVQKIFGIDLNAINLFHRTIQKQLDSDYNSEEFDHYLQAIYQYSSQELMSMGTIFKK